MGMASFFLLLQLDFEGWELPDLEIEGCWELGAEVEQAGVGVGVGEEPLARDACGGRMLR